MAITSPFFCLADFLCCRLQPAGLLLLCLTPHLGSESSLRRHNRVCIIVPIPEFTWQRSHLCCQYKIVVWLAIRLHLDTCLPYR